METEVKADQLRTNNPLPAIPPLPPSCGRARCLARPRASVYPKLARRGEWRAKDFGVVPRLRNEAGSIEYLLLALRLELPPSNTRGAPGGTPAILRKQVAIRESRIASKLLWHGGRAFPGGWFS